MASRSKVNAWQYPYVNIFKHVKVEDWKRSCKEGDVSSYMDKTLKCSVFRIRGSFATSSFILVPKSSTQSLGLTGRYFYLLFRPTPGKYFIVHLDVAAEEGQTVRISFSNSFKEFKSTSTWLQFPFLCGAAKDSVYHNTAQSARHGLVGPAPSAVRWTCLMMDLHYILSVYVNHRYIHLKSVKLCSSMAVKNMFTSDLLLNPGVSFSEAKMLGLVSSQGTGPMPRDMSFPVPRGQQWHDIYDYVRFPSEGDKLPFDSMQKVYLNPLSTCNPAQESAVREASRVVSISKPVKDRLALIQQITSPSAGKAQGRRGRPLLVSSVPELGVISASPSPSPQRSSPSPQRSSPDRLSRQPQAQARPLSPGSPAGRRFPGRRSPSPAAPGVREGGVHVYMNPEDELINRRQDSEEDKEEVEEEDEEQEREEVICTDVSAHLPSSQHSRQTLQPDPILRLNRIIGFGGGTTRYVLWTKEGDAVVYPCHAIIVSMTISSGQQRFFIGHTDKVSALTFNGNTTVLASAQTGPHSVVRVWNYLTGHCLAMFRAHAHSLTSLSLSHGGSVLCGVGKDTHGKTMVAVWSTARVNRGGEVSIRAKAHTEVDIHTMKVASFDDTRMVSCGRDNVRLWRLRNGTLRSCPVNLQEYHALDFTDLAFLQGELELPDLQERTLLVSSRSGHILEVDYSRVLVKNVRRLQPAREPHGQRRDKWTFNTGPGIAINSLSVTSAFVATGSEDGFLRLWPLDFSGVFLEAEHEGPVSHVSVSDDGLKVLAATSSGNLGYLDVRSRDYSTLMRSHTDSVLGFSVDGVRRHLTTASSDSTVRIWHMDTLQQLYDFVSEDRPCAVAFHPTLQVFSAGFSSGIVRVFDIPSAALLAEHRLHRGEVVGLTFSPDGEFMYSAGSMGSVVLYCSSEDDHPVVRVMGNVVAPGTDRAPDALAVSSDSRCLAFVGPSEYLVTVADAHCLDELLRVDISALDVGSSRLDSALKVSFSPASTGHLLVATSANKVLWVCSHTGRLLRQVCNVHKQQCSSLAVSEDSRFLLTAGHSALKVWDYHMKLDVSSQMFIGHSQPIRQLSFTPDQMGVVSVGDAIFLWDFLALPGDSSLSNHGSPARVRLVSPAEPGPKHQQDNRVTVSSGMPRQSAPRPSTPPPRWDTSDIDQEHQQALASLSLCDDPDQPPAGPHTPHGVASGPSVLKVTELDAHRPSSRGDSVKLPGELLVRPDCYRHFSARFKTSRPDQKAAAPPAGEEGLVLKAVIGYNGNGRGNMVWSPDTGLFAYSCGSVLVMENLHTGSQRHMLGHAEEISCLAVTHDAQMVASASASGGSKCVICIWNVSSGACRNTLSHHSGAVQSMAFSRDDLFFLSVGDFSDPVVALWSTRTFQLLSAVGMWGPVHGAAFSPSTAGRLACVGSEGVSFCSTHSQGLTAELKVHKVPVPWEVGDVEMTALCYGPVHGPSSSLFTATNRGQVCVWDCDTQRCLMTWEADEGEIGVLACRGVRLVTGSNTRRLRLWAVGGLRGRGSGGRGYNPASSGVRVLLEQEMTLDGAVVGAAFDDLMDMGIVGTTAGTLWYVNWAENSSIRLISGHKTKVNDVAFSSDESHFATCGEDGSVRVWSAPANELVVQFQVLNQGCGCLCWSPALPSSRGSACVAAGYSDGTLRVFRLATSEMEMKLHPHTVAVTAVQYSTHGHVILSAGKNGLLAVSSPETGASLRVLNDHRGAAVTNIQCVSKQYKDFGLEGNEMWLAASSDRRVSVWAADWPKDKCDLLDWLTFPAPAHTGAGGPPPSLAAFSQSEPGLVVYCGYAVEKELLFYSLARKQVVKKIALPHWVTCMSLSSCAQFIAVGSKGRVLMLMESSSGRFQNFLHHSDSLQTLRFSPSGQQLFSVAYSDIYLWAVKGF